MITLKAREKMPSLPDIPEQDQTPVVKSLLDLVEQLIKRVQQQDEEIALLKDDILNEVIKVRLKSIHDMFDEWEQNTPDTRQRIHYFIDIMTHNQHNIQQYGCPVGTLCSELSKINHVMQNDASQLFSLFREWLINQFSQLELEDDAEYLAMHLLTRTQGLATMMSTFGDDKFYPIEVQALKDWLDGL